MSPLMINPSGSNSNQKRRVLIADDETLLAQRLCEFLNSHGFEAKIVTTGGDVKKVIQTFEPHFLFYDLMLSEMNALQFLKTFNNATSLKVIVLSGHNDPANIRECMRLGAADYISKPISHDSVLSRLVLHLQKKQEVSEFSAKSEADYQSAQFFMHLTDLTLREALKGLPPPDSLHNLTGLMSVSLKAVRVSVIKVDREARKGIVVASSDKRSIGNLEIDLNKYPEISYVMNTEKPLAIDNLAADPTMHFVTKISKTINFNAMLVAPLRLNGNAWGVLSVRLPDTKKNATDFEIRWAQIVAHVAAMIITRDAELAKIPQPSGGALPESA